MFTEADARKANLIAPSAEHYTAQRPNYTDIVHYANEPPPPNAPTNGPFRPLIPSTLAVNMTPMSTKSGIKNPQTVIILAPLKSEIEITSHEASKNFAAPASKTESISSKAVNASEDTKFLDSHSVFRNDSKIYDNARTKFILEHDDEVFGIKLSDKANKLKDYASTSQRNPANNYGKNIDNNRDLQFLIDSASKTMEGTNKQSSHGKKSKIIGKMKHKVLKYLSKNSKKPYRLSKDILKIYKHTRKLRKHSENEQKRKEANLTKRMRNRNMYNKNKRSTRFKNEKVSYYRNKDPIQYNRKVHSGHDRNSMQYYRGNGDRKDYVNNNGKHTNKVLENFGKKHDSFDVSYVIQNQNYNRKTTRDNTKHNNKNAWDYDGKNIDANIPRSDAKYTTTKANKSSAVNRTRGCDNSNENCADYNIDITRRAEKSHTSRECDTNTENCDGDGLNTTKTRETIYAERGCNSRNCDDDAIDITKRYESDDTIDITRRVKQLDDDTIDNTRREEKSDYDTVDITRRVKELLRSEDADRIDTIDTSRRVKQFDDNIFDSTRNVARIDTRRKGKQIDTIDASRRVKQFDTIDLPTNAARIPVPRQCGNNGCPNGGPIKQPHKSPLDISRLVSTISRQQRYAHNIRPVQNVTNREYFISSFSENKRVFYNQKSISCERQ